MAEEEVIIDPRSLGRHIPETPEEFLESMSSFVGPEGQTAVLSDESSPEESIAHALPPGVIGANPDGTPKEGEFIAVCGAPWVPTSSIGGDQPILCRNCIEIGLSRGYQYT